jgi:hypothetical protein
MTTYIYIYVCVYVCMYVCIYIYTYINTCIYLDNTFIGHLPADYMYIYKHSHTSFLPLCRPILSIKTITKITNNPINFWGPQYYMLTPNRNLEYSPKSASWTPAKPGKTRPQARRTKTDGQKRKDLTTPGYHLFACLPD